MTLVVQVATAGSPVAVFPAPVTAGNIIVFCVSQRDNEPTTFGPPGFTLIDTYGANMSSGHDRRISMWYYVVQSDTTLNSLGDSQSFASQQGSDRVTAIEIAADYAGIHAAGIFTNSIMELDCGGPVTPAAGSSVIVIGTQLYDGGSGLLTPDTGVTEFADFGTTPLIWAGYIEDTSASGSYIVRGVSGSSGGTYIGVTAVFATAAPVAEFAMDDPSGRQPHTVNFTDLSTNIPTSWAWTFGDGGTSTSQNPTHTFTGSGTYSVTLTATNAHGSDSVTHFVNVSLNVGQEEQLPGGVLLEIYVTETGAARWDEATWDDAVWSRAQWTDVTPEGVQVDLQWGSHRPELGILSQSEAASWSVDIYDPDRILDPANADSPYYTDLVPGLPIRINHRLMTVKQGTVQTMGHDFTVGQLLNGYIRATDNRSVLSNAAVPHDTTLSDTLYGRAADAIAAAGLSVEIVPDQYGRDPDVVPWADPDSDRTVWDWIAEDAQGVLWVPYIDNVNRLGFRPWSDPWRTGKELASPQLVNLLSVVDYSGLYSVVQAQQTPGDGGNLVSRALTPPPRYGARTFTRTAETLDAGDWAQAVLDDRALSAVRWIPSRLYPLTADDVETFARIQAVELVAIYDPDTDPPVIVDAIVVGGSINIIGKRDDQAIWSFGFDAAQVASFPLYDDISAPPEFLMMDGDTQYLYPDG